MGDYLRVFRHGLFCLRQETGKNRASDLRDNTLCISLFYSKHRSFDTDRRPSDSLAICGESVNPILNQIKIGARESTTHLNHKPELKMMDIPCVDPCSFRPVFGICFKIKIQEQMIFL